MATPGNKVVGWFVAGLATFTLSSVFLMNKLVVQPNRPTASPARVFRIGYGEDAPYHFKGPDGKAAGLAVDLVREAARRRGIALDFVTAAHPGIPAIQKGETDFWVLLADRPERHALLHITEPYLVTDSIFLVLQEGGAKTIEELRTGRVSLLDFDIHRRNLKAILPNATPVPVESTRAAIMALEGGRADAAFLDQYAAAGALMSGISLKPLRPLSSPLPRYTLGLGSSFEAQAVADGIRREIRRMAQDGTVNRVGQNWGFFTGFSTDVISSIERNRMQNRLLWAGVGILAAGLLLIGLLADRLHLQRNAAHRSERRLRLSEERWQLALRGSNDGIWDYEPATKSVYFSDRWKQMLGFAPDELRNNWAAWIDLVHPDDAGRFRESVRAHLDAKTEMLAIEYRLRNKSGEYRWILSRGRAQWDSAGKPVRMTGFNTDITERKTAEEDLRAAQLRAEASNLAKSQFLANMSHEIRTPLNGVLGMVELLGGTDLNSDQREMLETVHTSSTVLLDLLNDILDLATIDAGRLEMANAAYSLRAVCGEVIRLFEPRALAKAIALQACFGDTPDALCGDAMRLKQILLNLVGNAIKFTPSGSVQLRVSQIASSIRFEVADTGIGIDAAAAPLLFEPFTQADLSTTRRFGGSGLGLAICHNLVRMLGGEIGFSSQPGAGSTFWFSIPYLPAQ